MNNGEKMKGDSMTTDFLRLGEIVLTNDQVTAFADKSGYNYASHELISGKPVLQPIGSALGTISISVELVAELGHDIEAIKRNIDAMLESGEPQKLVFANGVYQGEYVIEAISGSVQKTSPSGRLIILRQTMELKEWTRRELVTEKRQTQKATAKRVIIDR